jgi:hypothetical protein
MVRNGESWDLGEPDLDERGQPVIHDVASKLGCLRSSPDPPNYFPDEAEGYEEMQGQFQDTQSEQYLRDTIHTKGPECAREFSPALDSTNRESITETDRSDLSSHSQTWSQQRQAAEIPSLMTKPSDTSLLPESLFSEEAYPQTSLDTMDSMPSFVSSETHTKPPMFSNNPPFFPWAVQDNYLGPVHPLDLTAHYIEAQNVECKALSGCHPQSWEADPLKCMQLSSRSILVDSIIKTTTVDQNTGFDVSNQMSSIT